MSVLSVSCLPLSKKHGEWSWSKDPIIFLKKKTCLKNIWKIFTRQQQRDTCEGLLWWSWLSLATTSVPQLCPALQLLFPEHETDNTCLICSAVCLCIMFLALWGFFHEVSFSPNSGAVVKVRDKHRHPECFVCADCNLNLKQKGYFFVEGELYCETHARARMRPPEGYDTVTLYPKA